MRSIMLRDVPEDWKIERLGQLFNERKEKVSDKDFPPLSVTKGGVVPQMDHVAKTNDGDNRKRVCIGDFVINSRSDRKGSSGLSDYNGSVSLINIVLQPRNGHPRFLHHLLRSEAFQEEFFRFGHGIVADLWTTRYSELKGIPVALPNYATQKRIADFLDRETARVDELIEKKQRLVELIEEKRLTTIKSAVAKGLNTSVTMKNSSVDWIGDVPENWSMKKVSWLFKTIGSGATPNTQNQDYYDGDINWVNTGELCDGDIGATKKKITNKALADCSALKIYKPGAIIVALYGATIGKLGRLRVEATTNQACCVLANPTGILPTYIFYWLLGHRKDIIALSYGGGQPNISQKIIANLKVPVPSIQEQELIVNILENKTAKVNDIAYMTMRSIGKLIEYRSALITAAVTGQIDVDNWAREDAESYLDAIEEEMQA